MKKIAKNTTATNKVTEMYNRIKFVTLYPCYKDECNQVDLIYIDNGSEECFTMDGSQSNNSGDKIELKSGEMSLSSGTFLEFLELTELEIIDNVTEAEALDLRHAFETRTEAEWKSPIERYGYGCRNIDEVLTHIRFGQQNDSNPNNFKVKLCE